MGFVVDGVALGQIFLWMLQCYCQCHLIESPNFISSFLTLVPWSLHFRPCVVYLYEWHTLCCTYMCITLSVQHCDIYPYCLQKTGLQVFFLLTVIIQGYSKWLSGFYQLVIHNTLEIGVYVFFYLIEQHSNFLLHTLHVLYICTLCDSTNINTIIEFVQNVCSMLAVMVSVVVLIHIFSSGILAGRGGT